MFEVHERGVAGWTSRVLMTVMRCESTAGPDAPFPKDILFGILSFPASTYCAGPLSGFSAILMLDFVMQLRDERTVQAGKNVGV